MIERDAPRQADEFDAPPPTKAELWLWRLCMVAVYAGSAAAVGFGCGWLWGRLVPLLAGGAA